MKCSHGLEPLPDSVKFCYLLCRVSSCCTKPKCMISRQDVLCFTHLKVRPDKAVIFDSSLTRLHGLHSTPVRSKLFLKHSAALQSTVAVFMLLLFLAGHPPTRLPEHMLCQYFKCAPGRPYSIITSAVATATCYASGHANLCAVSFPLQLPGQLLLT